MRPSKKAELREVAIELLKPFLQGIDGLRPPHLELDGAPLHRGAAIGEPVGPAQEQIQPPAPHPVFSIHVSAPVHDALEKCHEHELCYHLVVGCRGKERRAVLSPEPPERAKQPSKREPPVRQHERARLVRDIGLDHPGLFREDLARLRGVLAVERSHLFQGEIAQAVRLDLDVERARQADARRAAPRGQLVVAHITNSTQDHGPREVSRAIRKPGPELAEHADQALADERVDLVKEQHHGPRARRRPSFEGSREELSVRSVGERRRLELRGEVAIRHLADREEDLAHGSAVVVPGDGGLFAREVERRVPALRRELFRQRAQGGGACTTK